MDTLIMPSAHCECRCHAATIAQAPAGKPMVAQPGPLLGIALTLAWVAVLMGLDDGLRRIGKAV